MISCRSEKIYSEWSLQNRESGEYLGEKEGSFCFAVEPSGDEYLWIIESTPGEEFLIKNKKSGKYLQLDGGKVVCAASADGDQEKMKWQYGGFDFVTQKNCGWYTLENNASDKNLHLARKENGVVMDASNRVEDFSSHWNIVRENGSDLSFSITPEKVVDASFLGTREAVAVSDTEIVSDYHGKNSWTLQKDISSFPRFTAENNPMLVALYNMALEEMQLDVRTDSTFMAGALWPDTWTRDAVYSIYFSYAWILPEVSRKTLEKQTLQNPKEALQDTGSGGSWPISTDRVVWAMAAWEYYLYTGDKTWLESVYDGLKYTALKDIHVAFDPNVGLFKGETCSMDWRTHTYPNWFINSVIGDSFSSGTNALHKFFYQFLGTAGRIINKPSEEIAMWDKYCNIVKENINKRFWDEKQGCYTCYLYPEYMGYKSTQRVGVMSNGLAAILGVSTSEQSTRMVENFPLYPYGAAVLYPSIPDDFSYHNKSVWPVWQTPYMYAARDAKNSAAVEHMMKSLIRAGALFLTHKENMTYDTGYDRGTALNSPRQLWSVASYISMVYRVLFGMTMTEEGIVFSPVVPDLVNGKLSLADFHYRDANLSINISGKGNTVKSIKVNGEEQNMPYLFPSTAKGDYVIDLVMTTEKASNKMNLVQAGPRKDWSPVEPVLEQDGEMINCEVVPGLSYFLCGKNIADKEITLPYDLSGESNGFYSVYSMDKQGFKSDCSNPVIKTDWQNVFEAEDAVSRGAFSNVHSDYSGRGFVVDLCAKPADFVFTIDVPADGDYALVLSGANGHGPDGTYCAIRSVYIDDQDAGSFILEATGDWNKWLNSNYVVRALKAGRHTVSLKFNPEDRGFDFNMSHGRENANDYNLDYLKVIRM
jgi:hypothetical protein